MPHYLHFCLLLFNEGHGRALWKFLMYDIFFTSPYLPKVLLMQNYRFKFAHGKKKLSGVAPVSKCCT